MTYSEAAKLARQASKSGRCTVLLSSYNHELARYQYEWAYWDYWYPRQDTPLYLFARDEGFYQDGEYTDSII
jgi:hypothetical protein